MADKKNWLGILVIVLVFGFLLTGCILNELLYENESSGKKAKYSENGHSYQIINEIKSWTDAKNYCEGKGGYLATITDSGEQKFIENLIVGGDKKSYWLGGYRDISDNFAWVTNEVMNYTNWGYGEPDSLVGNQNSISICRAPYSGVGWSVKLGEWDDEASNVSTNGFIIEWD